MSTKKLLFVIGHPDYKNSVANKAIVELLKTKYFPNAEYSNLIELYPDFKINAEAEQKKLVAADVVVYVYPMFWFNTTSLLKKYFEDVFVRGFSHQGAEKLKGKKVIASITTGATEEQFKENGLFGKTFEDFFPPLKQTFNFVSMDWKGHVVSYGISHQYRTDPAFKDKINEIATSHCKKLSDLINSL